MVGVVERFGEREREMGATKEREEVNRGENR